MAASQERVGGRARADDGHERKDRYHHGDLRESLIEATEALVRSKGAEHFSLADACRFAGVTTAAPYKHFRDKQEILEIVCQRGFESLKAATAAAVEKAGAGTLEAIQSMGRAYLATAVTQPNLFRLMFGQNSDLKTAGIVDEAGTGCLAYLVEQVSLYIERQGRAEDAQLVALKLWTFVHGAACLLIDHDYDKVAPGLDVEALIDSGSRDILGT
ncbi:MAG: TetR/AcrR family transcriptional regulator [Hyphomicrobiaceae bacterium]|nr:TetR/AcrR family transcriptional regulator [Hyphomicrobiaceae bacterium]